MSDTAASGMARGLGGRRNTATPLQSSILIQRVGSLSDVLRTTPIINAFKLKYPDRPIWVETMCSGVLERNPQVDTIRSAFNVYEAETVVNLNVPIGPSSASSITNRSPVGRYPSESMSMIDSFAAIAGIELPDRLLRFYSSKSALRWAVKEFPQTERRIAIHPSDKWNEVFARGVAHELMDQGYEVILIGTETPTFEIPCTHDLRTKTTFDGCAAILFGCCMFIGVDGFFLHLAMSQGVPVVGFFQHSVPFFELSEGRAIAIEGNITIDSALEAVNVLKDE